MHIHLSKYDVLLIRDSTLAGLEADDQGEAFCEEAIGCLEDNDIETIEARAGGSADEFMMEIFEMWDGGDPVELVELMSENLANLDIELTFDDIDADEDEEIDDDDDEWESDDVEEDDEFAEF